MMEAEHGIIHFLHEVAADDVHGLTKSQENYGDSWKKRGGIGAYMMLARKWDRIERQLGGNPMYDIFSHIVRDERSEGLIDDIRDLRRYLMLVEAEMRRLDVPAAVTTHRDNA